MKQRTLSLALLAALTLQAAILAGEQEGVRVGVLIAVWNLDRSHRQAGYDLDRDIGGEWLGSKTSVDDERPPHRVRLDEVEHRLRGVQWDVLDSPRFAAELPQTLDVAEVAMGQPDGIQLVQSPPICGCPQDELS